MKGTPLKGVEPATNKNFNDIFWCRDIKSMTFDMQRAICRACCIGQASSPNGRIVPTVPFGDISCREWGIGASPKGAGPRQKTPQ